MRRSYRARAAIAIRTARSAPPRRRLTLVPAHELLDFGVALEAEVLLVLVVGAVEERVICERDHLQDVDAIGALRHFVHHVHAEADQAIGERVRRWAVVR